MPRLTLLPLVVAGLAGALPSVAQKTSTWTGDGSDNNWTTTENWDTPEDPNGGDTAIVPQPFNLTLDANRSVSLLTLDGQTGQFVSITGGAQLTVQNGLLADNFVLNGSGTLVSSNNSVLSGVVSLNNWTTTLGGSTSMASGALTTSSVLNLPGNVTWGTATLGGTGTVNLSGDLTKNHLPDPSHSSLFNPVVLELSGTLRAESGIIVLAPDELNLSGSAEFATGAAGRLRLLSDEVTYQDITFTNAGEMDITDDILGTPGSIKIRGTAISSGSEAVELGANGTYDAAGATLSGPWLMRGAELLGPVSFAGGGFRWERGNIGPETTNEGTAPGDFVISPLGSPAPQALGKFTNRGHVTQTGNFKLAEGTQGTGLVAPELVLEAGSTWLLDGTAVLNPGVTTGEEPKVTAEAGSILSHEGMITTATGRVAIPARFSGGQIRNSAGRLELAGEGNSFSGTAFSVLNDEGLGSRIQLTGSSFLQATVAFTNGGVFDLRERERGTAIRSLTGTGDGEGQLGFGTVRIPTGAISLKTPPSLIDFSSGDPLGGQVGAKFRVFRDGGGAESVAILFEQITNPLTEKPATLVVRGNFEWAARTITTEAGLGQIPPASAVGVLVNESEQFKILPASALTLSDVKFLNDGTVQFGDGTATTLTIRRSPFTNAGLLELRGDVDFSVSDGAAASLFTNKAGGSVVKTEGTSTSSMPMDLDNVGTVEVRSGQITVGGSISQYDNEDKILAGGRWVVRDGGILKLGSIDEISALRFPAGGPPPPPGQQGAQIVIDGAGSQILNSNDQPLFDQAGLLLSERSRFSVEADATVDFGGDLVIDGGLLGGTGTVTAPNVNVGAKGTVSPGQSPGTLTIVGALNFLADSRYRFEASAGAHDQIAVSGPVTLGGYFEPVFLDGFIPTVGQSFTVLTADSITGSFDGQLLGCVPDGVRFTFQNTGTSLIATVAAATYPDYSSWAAEHFDATDLADPAISGRDADPEGDGIVNVLEFLTGNSPTKSGPLPWVFSDFVPADGSNAATVTVAFPWRDGVPGEEFYFEESDDLLGWDPASSETLSDVTADGFRSLVIRLTGTDPATGPRFFRLGARPAP